MTITGRSSTERSSQAAEVSWQGMPKRRWFAPRREIGAHNDQRDGVALTGAETVLQPIKHQSRGNPAQAPAPRVPL